MIGPSPQAVEAAVEVLLSAGVLSADLLVTLGSGQKNPWDSEAEITIPYTDIPGWASPGVEGHGGELSLVRMGEDNVLVMVGRHHYYEARSYEAVAAPLKAAHKLGVRRALFTNSAGAVREDLRQGDFVLITDHILQHGPDLADMLRDAWEEGVVTEYWQAGGTILRQAAQQSDIPLSEGILLCVTGPAYETGAEIEMARRMGADVVAMSLAPEALIAWSLGFEVSGLSLVTNRAGSDGHTDLLHHDVVEAALRMQPVLERLLREAVPCMLPGSDRDGQDTSHTPRGQ
ncbi:purine-nucleoside phosphorylase [Gemmatimonadota bacterium]